MAIQFARIEIVSRSLEGNSCCKAAYNVNPSWHREKMKGNTYGGCRGTKSFVGHYGFVVLV